jgi:uncharacterized protein (DUF2147 family)
MRELHHIRWWSSAAASLTLLWAGALLAPGATAEEPTDKADEANEVGKAEKAEKAEKADKADKASEVEGVWASKGAVFAIERSGDTLEATVVALRKPRPDRKNVKEELRGRPLIGLQLLSDYRFKKGRWRGDFYDPGSGRTYSSHIRLDDEGNLRLRAYVLFLGHTEVMEPASNCTERIVAMLEVSGAEGLCPP